MSLPQGAYIVSLSKKTPKLVIAFSPAVPQFAKLVGKTVSDRLSRRDWARTMGIFGLMLG